MANLDHIKWLREGVESWNKRREKHHFFPDFSEVSIPVELRGSSYKERSPFYFSLKEINLRNANFRNASLMGPRPQESQFAACPASRGRI